MSEQRRRDITALVTAHGRVGLADLARQFAVSEMTIRRDLDELTERGALLRVRGGAVAAGDAHDAAPARPAQAAPTTATTSATQAPPPEPPPARVRRPVDDLFGPPPAPPPPAPPPPPVPTHRGASDLAERLAGAATLILDAGPDAVALARALAEPGTSTGTSRGQLVITRDPAVADAVTASPTRGGVRVLLTGGEARPGEPGLLGPWACAPLADVHVAHAVLTACGLDATGWWCPSPESAQWAAAAAAHADTLTLWVPPAALGARGTARAGDLTGVARVVVAGPLSRDGLAGDTLAAVSHAGIEVVLART